MSDSISLSFTASTLSPSDIDDDMQHGLFLLLNCVSSELRTLGLNQDSSLLATGTPLYAFRLEPSPFCEQKRKGSRPFRFTSAGQTERERGVNKKKLRQTVYSPPG